MQPHAVIIISNCSSNQKDLSPINPSIQQWATEVWHSKLSKYKSSAIEYSLENQLMNPGIQSREYPATAIV
jgi:hypothetical protein